MQRRVEHNLAVVSLGAFFMYAASDALSQCVEFLRAQDTGGHRRSRTGRRHIFLDLARMARSGFTSGLLSGFLAVFYFAWLDRTWQPANLLGVLGQPHSDSAQRRAQWACVAGKVATDVGIYEPICKRTPSYCLRASAPPPSPPVEPHCTRLLCPPALPADDTVYVTLQALLRGDGLSAARHEVATKVLRVWAMAPRYWTFVDTINFSLVVRAPSCPRSPQHHAPTPHACAFVIVDSPGDLLSITRCLDPQSLRLRPLTNALMSIPWGMYISSVANN